MLVGSALCRAEPSESRGGHGLAAKPPAKGQAAMRCGGSLTAPTSLHKGAEKGEPTPTVVGGGSSPPALKLVGGALCWAEPSETTPTEPEHLDSQAPPTLRLGALQSVP